MLARVICAVSVFLAAAVMPLPVAASCSNSSVSGTYGFEASGVDGKGLPTAAVGQFQATAGTPTGSMVGVETVSSDGTIASFSLTGTYSISSNCTGSFTVHEAGGVSHYRAVLVEGNSTIEFVETDAGVRNAGNAVQQGAATCTKKALGTKYGFQNGGLEIGIGGVIFLDRLSLDGKGGITGTESGTTAGVPEKGVPVSGTYSVNSNCIGSAELTPQGGSTRNFNFVVVGGGATLFAIESDPMTVITGALKQ
ncbi:MAG: hypothetical protein WB952_19480 [Terriglobales bacterium]